MSTYRIHPNKSNTIIESTDQNTGNNEVMELWYGNKGISRHLVQFDFTAYNAAYALGHVPHITATTASFHLTPCTPILEDSEYYTSIQAKSFDLEVKIMQSAWDAGTGYDFIGIDKEDGFSNWYSATTLNPWAAEGGDFLYTAFSGHSDLGDETFSGAVIDEIELWETFTGNNHGFCVKFTDGYEELSGSVRNISKYYTQHTNFQYNQPYIELSWEDQVTDQRDELGYGLDKRIYFYLKRDGQFTSANSVSGVSINYASDQFTDVAITGIVEQFPGIYYVEQTWPTYAIPDASGETFTDTWDIQFNAGDPFVSVALSGSLASDLGQWTYGQTDILYFDGYSLGVPNLKEEYKLGDIIHLDVTVYQTYTSTRSVLKNLEYRIYLINGTDETNVTMVDWSPVNYSSDINWIQLNTAWLHVDYKYEIEFRYGIDNTMLSKTSDDKFEFKVVS
jgi:hypothetical protein